MTSFAQADDFELFTRIRGQFTLTRLSTGVYDCPADFSEMTLCVYSREAFKPPQCNGHSLTAKEASRMLRHLERHRTEHIGWFARGGIGCERRYPFDRESGAGCRGGAWDSQQRVGRGGRRPSRWGYVDGCG